MDKFNRCYEQIQLKRQLELIQINGINIYKIFIIFNGELMGTKIVEI